MNSHKNNELVIYDKDNQELFLENNIVVSEHFYSIQGEGKYTGTPAVFLRLTGCNLLCKGINDNNESWVCDSIKSWKKGHVYTMDHLVELFIENNYTKHLLNGAHLVLTGGEPMLQQKNFNSFISSLEDTLEQTFFTEIETNGTIEINMETYNNINHWTISPKLSNSGAEKKDSKLNIFKMSFLEREDFILKFVINSEKDIIEMKNIINDIHPRLIHSDHKRLQQIMIMPGTDTKSKLNEIMPKIIEFTKNDYCSVSNRLHIQVYNQKLGV